MTDQPNFIKHVPPDGAAYLDALERDWSSVLGSPKWANRVMAYGDEAWSFRRMVAWLRREHLDFQAGSGEVSPFFEFLGALRTRISEVSPNSTEGHQLFGLCEFLQASPFHEISNLFATCVLEHIVEDSDRWRSLFISRWQRHSRAELRAALAFSTWRMAFKHKSDLLLSMATDPDDFVRQSVLQSLWYEQTYNREYHSAIRKIVDLAAAGQPSNEYLLKFATEVRSRLSTSSEKPR